MENWSKVFKFMPLMLQGLGVTLILSVIIIIGGTLLGLLVAVAYTTKNKIPSRIVGIYVYIFRGTPLLLQLFVGYYGIAYLGVDINIWVAVSVVMILYAGAYISEIFRSGIESIPKGQYEAAACLNLSKWVTFTRVIIPQVMRKVSPSLIGAYIGFVKDTSIASLIGFSEFLKKSKIAINSTKLPLQVYFVVGVIFFLICFPMSRVTAIMEKKRKG